MAKKVISLFSGAGGMDLGFIQAGYQIIWANDFFEDAVNSYKKNIGDHIVHGDISQIDSNDIPDHVDVIIGGFPCQGFSIANSNRRENDERNFLYKEMLRIIKDKQPKIFVAENVKGILSLGKGQVIKLIISDFKKLGYNVEYRILNASDYGVPQNRERVIIIGNKINKKNIFPQKTHSDSPADKLKPKKTVKEAIGFLSEVDPSEEVINLCGKKIYNHIAATNVHKKFWGRKYKVDQADICDYLKKYRDESGYTTKDIDGIFGYKYTAGHWFRKDNSSGSIPKPEDWWKLKEILKFDDTYDEEVTTFVEKEIQYEQSLRITNWDRPSDTITATSPEIHVNKKRRLSVRECAILQTFPDNYIFTGTRSKMYTQIGNAVPVLLSKKIAECVSKMIESEDDN